MADLAAIMAKRRQKLDSASEDEGMYFKSPLSGGPQSKGKAPVSGPKGPGSNQRAQPPAPQPHAPQAPQHSMVKGGPGSGFNVNLQEEAMQESEEDDEEDDEEDEDPLDQIAEYQRQLRAKDSTLSGNSGIQMPESGAQMPGSGFQMPGSGIQMPGSGPQLQMPGSGAQAPPLNLDLAEDRETSADIEEEEESEVAEYQLQLRNRDEADAVAGLAVGNLEEVVESRAAPKSQNGVMAEAPATGQSALGHLMEDSMIGEAPQECTCTPGSQVLCPYCVMVNGPASNGSTASSMKSPNSSIAPSIAPSMPNSYSSFAGMPSQKMPQAPASHASLASTANQLGQGPGWSQGRQAVDATKQQAQPSVPQTPAPSAAKPPKKKSSGIFCCFSPNIEEDPQPPKAPQSNQSASSNGTVPHPPMSNGRPASTGSGPLGGEDEIVQDGVAMGGITSTSEDVIQLDEAVIQCNVGLSVHDGTEPMSGAPLSGMPMSNAGPMSNGAPMSNNMMPPLSTGSVNSPPSWTPPSAMPQAQQAAQQVAQQASTLTEANMANFAPASRNRKAAPTSGTSLFSVAEHSASVDVSGVAGAPASRKGGALAPLSASLQELQGLDDRRNRYLEAMHNKPPPSGKAAAPISNTLLELQQRQVVQNAVQQIGN